ncbi:uncharacterized protein [Clytia hemisphaerica]|uniref:Uncharacterized protein n=1 Tax=Clytia hemisphaerica TaxID=252671 RepID=A0A7M5V0D3_9CNID
MGSAEKALALVTGMKVMSLEDAASAGHVAHHINSAPMINMIFPGSLLINDDANVGSTDTKKFQDVGKLLEEKNQNFGAKLLLVEETDQSGYKKALDDGKDEKECVILSSSLAHEWDYDFTNLKPAWLSENFKRGGVEYLRPYGWMRYGIDVKSKFDSGDATWLGESGTRHHSSPNEWIVTYHGTDCVAATKIADTDKSNHKRFQLRMGSNNVYGRGIYTTNSPKEAEEYARSRSSGKAEYIYIYQIRLNPKRIKDHTDSNKNDVRYTKKKWISHKGVYYFITPNEIKEDIRIYGLLEKKI